MSQPLPRRRPSRRPRRSAGLPPGGAGRASGPVIVVTDLAPSPCSPSVSWPRSALSPSYGRLLRLRLRRLGDDLDDLLRRLLSRDQFGHGVVDLLADGRRVRLVEVELEAGRGRQRVGDRLELGSVTADSSPLSTGGTPRGGDCLGVVLLLSANFRKSARRAGRRRRTARAAAAAERVPAEPLPPSTDGKVKSPRSVPEALAGVLLHGRRPLAHQFHGGLAVAHGRGGAAVGGLQPSRSCRRRTGADQLLQHRLPSRQVGAGEVALVPPGLLEQAGPGWRSYAYRTNQRRPLVVAGERYRGDALGLGPLHAPGGRPRLRAGC